MTLPEGEAERVMRAIMEGKATDAQIGAFLLLLRQRGESVQEITGFARVMREKATRVQAPSGVVLDTCGTGGDASGTFNISTLAALVAAAAGVHVAKHGNRSVSSRVGSADLLEGLGVELQLTPQGVADSLRDTHFGFLFAPLHHSAMRHAAGPRRELGVRTVFNVLGPLTNPAGATHQILGVYDAALVPTLAEVLRELRSERALVVHGEDGLDEISPTGPTRVAELFRGRIEMHTWSPEDVGLERCTLQAIQGGSLEENVAIARRVLDGEPGAHQNAVCLNAGAALYVAGKVDDLWKGVQESRLLLESGQVRRKLAEIVEYTQRLGG
ncbi:MAG: anthranilate phosphoribosyltransferase [Candidatus Latescibacterota bacterium]|nr:MAG: anthranilate phosphoribosyltransferase [Candidatus Latescibacterota bacterium]